ncbi:hypothetical protein [Kozakia baliensis]|uniref:hypothetical protein n=1 Tax=Kozakia baliensis TaxID=153496 RepID=UPI0011E02791
MTAPFRLIEEMLFERVMQKFRSPGDCQRFVSAFSTLRNLFVPPASIDNSISRHIHRIRSFVQWKNALAA